MLIYSFLHYRKTVLTFYDEDGVKEDITIEHKVASRVTTAYGDNGKRIGIVARKKLSDPGAFPVCIIHQHKGWKLTVGWDRNKEQFTVDVQGNSAKELHYQGPAKDAQLDGYIPTLNCWGINSLIKLNGVTVVPGSTEI